MNGYDHDMDREDWKRLWVAVGLAAIYGPACILAVWMLWRLFQWARGI